VPTGKVKWYDAEKGFGFLNSDDGGDVYVRASALPEGVTSLRSGSRVEFGVVEGRRGAQALQVRLLDPPPSVSRAQSKAQSKAQRDAKRKAPEEMTVIVEDTIRLLDDVENAYRAGRHPERSTGKRAAAVLRALADELER
jgi:cold shock protein